MRTPKLPPPADFDDDLPELGDDFFANARRGSEVLSPEFLAANRAHLEAKRRTGRPAAEDPKVGVHIRLDAPLVRHLRAQGRGWQTRVNNALTRLIAMGEL